MRRASNEVKLISYEELLGIDENSEVVMIPLSKMHECEDHPFKVKDDDAMYELADSIRELGVLQPGLLRPRSDSEYDIVWGHRRKRASELAGLEEMPCIVRRMTDKEAIDMMVDSNLHRPELLPSEKAYAYKMRYEQTSHQGKRTDLTLCQVGTKLMAENNPDSVRQIQRYISLTKLVVELMDLVDEKKLAFNAGVELAALDEAAQDTLIRFIEDNEKIPSVPQAEEIKKIYKEGEKLKYSDLENILSKEKKKTKGNLTLKTERLESFFTEDYTKEEKEKIIYQLLEEWKRSNTASQSNGNLKGQIGIEDWDEGKYMPNKD